MFTSLNEQRTIAYVGINPDAITIVYIFKYDDDQADIDTYSSVTILIFSGISRYQILL